jgi:hypothetical protein
VIRAIVTLALVAGFIWAGMTIKLGKRTFFGHIGHIWHSEEAEEMKEGVKETTGPAVKKLERGFEAGYHAIKDGSGSGAGQHSPDAPAP